ncbi:T9SS type B sorting domain-containing protein [Flagellimonas amoyensis]|uniref:T9SS type B sorting domain-containing protein n=1 Tax=Flagellimonas amoyensis TaxID=2169401 RepID=UPI000D3A3B96|nr:T9SS type B sorting domain-containing protein [Allomuricauda amoyensis]
MIKLLLCYFSMGTEKKFSCAPPHLLFKKLMQHLTIALVMLLGMQANAQDLDTWFTADRAININPAPVGQIQLFTPYPPASGTPVSRWYDFIDFVPQDAIPHPDPANYPMPFPAGFDYTYPNSGIYPQFLNPAGSIPGLPTLERNSMNFNPIVRFDGSGNGQALHFKPDSRQNVTVFVVFRALGAGNTAQTQRLLFGGDIDQQHWSSNSNQWLTNLSLGVSDGNRFSVGRTWFGDGGNGYFQNGSVDLLGKPAIGMFKRQALVDSENLITHVNGIPDISTVRFEINADNDLYFFNRLGKHFNSNDANRNLTGDIAEVMLFDGPLPVLETQIVESYLAIKYGLTLSNGPGLGSEIGNNNFNYIAADGTVIWQAENIYKYDIAGLGADRDEDQNAPILKLRYNLHQRISKSENPEAIVTMSTNNNFSTDNLDDTRPEIDKNGLFTFLHNFLIWANDRGSLSATNMELPISGDITERISREWRVQAIRSPGVDAISNISVRIDLSGSDILDNGDCGLKLLIDTDKDGDFTTGPITMIDATSVDMAGNAYFDNVNFEHRDVFTVGFGDTEPPTASNPLDITICDTPPPADPLVVTDEADNCAIASVILQSEATDGNTNPETITRTYRITDTSGNFIDVTQTNYVYLSPDVDDIVDQVVCDSYTLPAITGNNLTGNEAYYSGSGSTGTQFSPGDNITVSGTYYIYDETGTTPNCFDEESFIVTVNTTPVAPAANNQIFCSTDNPTGADLVPAISATITWYSDAGLTSIVAPADPLISQNYYVTQTINSCEGLATIIVVTVTDQPDAGTNGATTICEGDLLNDADLFALLGGTPEPGGTWSPAFNGAGVYTYTVTATAPCTNDATATVTVSEQQQPDAGTNGATTICEGDLLNDADLFALLGGTPEPGGTWSPAFNGAGVYTYTVTATAPCTNDATATVTVSEQQQPDAGTNGATTICEGDLLNDADLFALLGGTPEPGGTWSPAFNGAGVYTYTVTANGSCLSSSTSQVTVIEENLGASVEPVYLCDGNNLPSNSIEVSFVDPEANNDLMYALDSSDPNDFILSPDFTNISAGEHRLFIMRSNGCVFEYPFTIDDIEPLELELLNNHVNGITANVTGGSGPYTYYFDNQNGTSSNTYTINRNGTFMVTVVDDNGCEVTASISMNFVDISIPDFFTPNNDGKNDFWGPKNTEAFPNIQTFIFDRYGRKIQILGQFDVWKGYYDSKPLPSGDYWYIVKLNDESGREFVGHFTLFR